MVSVGRRRAGHLETQPPFHSLHAATREESGHVAALSCALWAPYKLSWGKDGALLPLPYRTEPKQLQALGTALGVSIPLC